MQKILVITDHIMILNKIINMSFWLNAPCAFNIPNNMEADEFKLIFSKFVKCKIITPNDINYPYNYTYNLTPGLISDEMIIKLSEYEFNKIKEYWDIKSFNDELNIQLKEYYSQYSFNEIKKQILLKNILV